MTVEVARLRSTAWRRWWREWQRARKAEHVSGVLAAARATRVVRAWRTWAHAKHTRHVKGDAALDVAEGRRKAKLFAAWRLVAAIRAEHARMVDRMVQGKARHLKREIFESMRAHVRHR